MPDKFCELCSCTGHPSEGMPKSLSGNRKCPVMGGKNICVVCCDYDLEGGMAAADTLKETCRISGKTPWEVHQGCVACPHGGPDLDKPHELVAFRGQDGKTITSGPVFKKAIADLKVEHVKKIEWLKKVKVEDLPSLKKRKEKP